MPELIFYTAMMKSRPAPIEGPQLNLGPPQTPVWRKVLRVLPSLADRNFLGGLQRRAGAWLEAAGDRRRLLSTCPWLADYEAMRWACARELVAAHRHYTTTISTWGMAASLELAVFLLAACRAMKPRRVLDLGSGFSSFVLRKYGQEADSGIEVVSVDDSRDWLDKSAAFIRSQGLVADGLLTWEAFRAATNHRFD